MIEVAAGVLTDVQGRVLLMQRLPGTHLAGSWEFPGGKLEPGEDAERALARELREELGIEAHHFEPLISLPWHYPEKSIRLHAQRVTGWHGTPHPREGHPLRWMHPGGIDADAMPAADRPVLAALRLPPHYAISPADMRDRAVVEVWLRKRRESETLIQLRLPRFERAAVRAVILDAAEAMPGLRPRLLLNHDIGLARELGIGLQLRALQLRELRERPLPVDAWIGASCHDADELELAARIGADFATLSPVCASSSHPEGSPLGWDAFARLVADARLPVYALGGIEPDDLDRTRAAGAQGVAGISAFARA